MSARDHLTVIEQHLFWEVLRLRPDATGTTIWSDYQERTKTHVAVGQIYATLDRMERKRYIVSSIKPTIGCDEKCRDEGGQITVYRQDCLAMIEPGTTGTNWAAIAPADARNEPQPPGAEQTQSAHPTLHLADDADAPHGEDGQAIIIDDTIHVWRNGRWECCCLVWHMLSDHFDIHPDELSHHWYTCHSPYTQQKAPCLTVQPGIQ